MSSGVGCGIVAEMGTSFPALILFLIYLGGMLVLFAYSVSLCGDLYPGVFFGRFMLMFIIFFVVVLNFEFGETFFGEELLGDACQFDSGYFGVPLLYSFGGYNLLIIGFGLLLTLIVVQSWFMGFHLFL